MSRIDNATLILNTTTSTNAVKLRVYAVNYNVLRIMAGKLNACKSVKLVNLISLRQNSNCGNVVSESLIIRRESFLRNLQRLNGFWELIIGQFLRDSLDPNPNKLYIMDNIKYTERWGINRWVVLTKDTKITLKSY